MEQREKNLKVLKSHELGGDSKDLAVKSICCDALS
jgi:hypothetical protein